MFKIVINRLLTSLLNDLQIIVISVPVLTPHNVIFPVFQFHVWNAVTHDEKLSIADDTLRFILIDSEEVIVFDIDLGRYCWPSKWDMPIFISPLLYF